MGGRGSSSGISTGGKIYGTEYKKILQFGNILFVSKNEGLATAPLETMTKGRVYVTINTEKELKFISYYDANNKRSKTIDLDKAHKGMKPHVHHGYEHNENDGKKGAAKLTTKEKKMLDKVNNLWYNYNRKV